MIRENVLEYFEDGQEEIFRWSHCPSITQKLWDFNLCFWTKNLGELHLPTGRIVASDPTVFFDEKPFVIQVEKGSYDVILSVARINQQFEQRSFEHERVAFAMIKFNEKRPIRWELALRENDDLSKEMDEKFFGYGVDSGTGCFMDVETQKILNDLLFDEEYKFFDFLHNQMQKNYVPTRDWINYDFEGLPHNNLIAFSSGWGDGGYASYFGFDADNQVVCLVTDFEVVKDSEVV